MKIGILTYHRSENYGALLQAIALRYTIEHMGHEAYFIDYWPDHQRLGYLVPKYPWSLILKHPRTGLRKFLDILWMHKRKTNFKAFIRKYIEPYCHSTNEAYEVVVHGSDQIWRKQSFVNEETNCYNPYYFGDHSIKCKRKLSYSASSDKIIEKTNDKKRYKELLSHLDAISVREETLLNDIQQLGFKDAKLTLDPTLLLNSAQWDNIICTKETKERYVLLYDLQNTFDFQNVKQFANSLGCRLIRISGSAFFSLRRLDKTTCNPIDFIKYIKNAEYVITSSYHGLVFSIIYHKPFYASCTYSQARMKSLLNRIGLEERFIYETSSIPSGLPNIDYNKVDEKLLTQRLCSIHYLEENLY